MAPRITTAPDAAQAPEIPVGPLAPPATDPHALTCSLAQAATHMGVSEKTVRKLVAAGHITAFRIGAKRLRISRASVADYLERHRVGRPVPVAPTRARRVHHAAHQRSVEALRKMGVRV